jgi:hypothetical protein
MSPTQPTPTSRPRAVDIAFWLSLLGSVLAIVGGSLGLTRSFTTSPDSFATSLTEAQVHQILVLHGGVGAVFIVAGLALGFLAGRTRNGDKRFRRALAALAAALVLLVFVVALLAPYALEIIALISVIPIAVAATLYTRPGAAAWFDAVDHGAQPDG